MPPLNTRIARSGTKTIPFSQTIASAPAIPEHPLSMPGNPAPSRGLLPVELMYDFNIYRFNPESPHFIRGLVDVNNTIRDTALQAYAQAGGKVQ
jgi:hypothetical protein